MQHPTRLLLEVCEAFCQMLSLLTLPSFLEKNGLFLLLDYR